MVNKIEKEKYKTYIFNINLLYLAFLIYKYDILLRKLYNYKTNNNKATKIQTLYSKPVTIIIY